MINYIQRKKDTRIAVDLAKKKVEETATKKKDRQRRKIKKESVHVLKKKEIDEFSLQMWREKKIRFT